MKIILTGANGYLGRLLSTAFLSKGWKVIQNLETPEGKRWRLPYKIANEQMATADVLVHGAWDMSFTSKEEAFQTNVIGSRNLIRQAASQHVKKIIFISSLSAYPGCYSRYGKMKLAVEKEVLEVDRIVIRPGLVYGRNSGGMVGKLSNLVSKLPIIPLPCSSVKQYLIQEEIVASFICRSVMGEIPSGIYSLGEHPPLSMKEIILKIASTTGKKPLIVPIPWRLAWLGLSLAEMLSLRIPVHSDNLLGLVKNNPTPDFSLFLQSKNVNGCG